MEAFSRKQRKKRKLLELHKFLRRNSIFLSSSKDHWERKGEDYSYVDSRRTRRLHNAYNCKWNSEVKFYKRQGVLYIDA